MSPEFSLLSSREPIGQQRNVAKKEKKKKEQIKRKEKEKKKETNLFKNKNVRKVCLLIIVKKINRIVVLYTGVTRTPANIKDRELCNKSERQETVKFCYKVLHLRSLWRPIGYTSAPVDFMKTFIRCIKEKIFRN